MNIKIYNDGKGKHQSFEASLDEHYGNAYINAYGYGRDEEEAKENLKNDIMQLFAKIT